MTLTIPCSSPLRSALAVGAVCALAAMSYGASAEDKESKGEKKSNIKPYDEVIPEDAETKIGLFRVHRVGDKLYYEIAPANYGQDLLWVTQIAETTAGHSYAGMPAGSRVARWERRGDKILLRDTRVDIRADTTDPIATAVRASNLAPIIKTFAIQAHGKD